MSRAHASSADIDLSWRSELAALSTLAAMLHNQFAQPREAVAIELLGDAVKVRISGMGRAADDALRLPFSLAGRGGCLSLSPSLLKRLVPNGLVSQYLELSGLAQRCLVFEHLMLENLVKAERALALSVSFTASPTNVAGVERMSLSVTLDFEADSKPLYAWLELDLDCASQLHRLLTQHAALKPRTLDSFPMAISLQAGWQHLTVEELQNLQITDVLMLDHPSSGVRVVVQDCLWALAEADEYNLHLTTHLKPVFSFKEPYMVPVDSAAPESVVTRLEQASVCVVCEIASLELSLGLVRTLGEGSVLSVSESPDVTVVIRANGKVFGQGELVKLGEGLGVRLTSLDCHE